MSHFPLAEVYVRALDFCLTLACRARDNGEVPVGAVVLDSNGDIVGQGWNQREKMVDVVDGKTYEADPCGHAEILALRAAGRTLGRWRLSECTLVVTLEPCAMCAGAIVNARIGRLVFGAWDEKAGACGSVRDLVRDSRLNHQVQVYGGVREQECAAQLTEFFSKLRTDNL